MEQETRTDGDGSRGKQKLRKKKKNKTTIHPSLCLSLVVVYGQERSHSREI